MRLPLPVFDPIAVAAKDSQAVREVVPLDVAVVRIDVAVLGAVLTSTALPMVDFNACIPSVGPWLASETLLLRRMQVKREANAVTKP